MFLKVKSSGNNYIKVSINLSTHIDTNLMKTKIRGSAVTIIYVFSRKGHTNTVPGWKVGIITMINKGSQKYKNNKME